MGKLKGTHMPEQQKVDYYSMKGKKSFQLYTEWIEIFEVLEDKDAGQLIKHIFRYVNDKHPETDNKLVELAFVQVRQQLKRDLKKWEALCEKNRDNGALGGRPKKKPKLTRRLFSKPKEPDKVEVEDKVKDKVEVKENKNILVFPFESDTFIRSWEEWKNYKKEEHRFHYASLASEQKALTKLKNLSNAQEKIAIEILDESIANGWHGLFAIGASNAPKDNVKRKYKL